VLQRSMAEGLAARESRMITSTGDAKEGRRGGDAAAMSVRLRQERPEMDHGEQGGRRGDKGGARRKRLQQMKVRCVNRLFRGVNRLFRAAPADEGESYNMFSVTFRFSAGKVHIQYECLNLAGT
jgi:hypothetical protein